MNKNILYLFLFAGFASCNFVIKSMQPKRQPDISTFCLDETKAMPVSIFFETPENHPEDFIEAIIEKTSDNQYQIIVREDPYVDPNQQNKKPYKLSLDQHALSTMLCNSTKNLSKTAPVYTASGEQTDTKRTTRYSYCKVSISNKDVYVKVGEDTISAALLSTHKKKKKPQKVLVSSGSDEEEAPVNLSEPQKETIKEKVVVPVHPKDFKKPHTILTDSPEERSRIIEALEKQRQEELDNKAKELLEQENMEKEKKNKEYLKAFNLYFHQEYQKKIVDSIQSWDENPSLKMNEKKKIIAIDEELKKLGLPPLTPEVYFDALKANHMVELGSWHIEQYNLYNATLSRDNQTPLTYEKFHEVMHKSRLGFTEQAQEVAYTNRLKEMDDQAQKQLAFIKEIDEKTKHIQAKHDQYCTINYLKSRGWELSRDAVITEGVIIAAQGIRSLFPRQDVAEVIELYDTAIANEQREMDFKKEALSLMETKEELEKKFHKELFSKVEKNQKILHLDGKKSEKELLDSLKKQSDKYARK